MDKAQQYEHLFTSLVEYNNHVNLTAITQREEVYAKHFEDSAAAAPFIEQGAKVLDIGTGAGFPALPLAIERQDLTITALDSVNKKLVFVAQIAQSLNLRVRTVHCRIEDFKEFGYDVAVSRAVAPLNTLLEYAIPFLRVGGIFIVYKAHLGQEIEDSANALATLGSKIEKIHEFTIQDSLRTLVIVKKIAPTSPKYPRPRNAARLKPL